MNAPDAVPIPPEPVSGDFSSLRDYFQDLWDCQSPGFSAALDLECDPQNRRAITESVTVLDASLTPDGVIVRYQVDLSDFAACKDITCRWTFIRQVIGTRIGTHWHFRPHIPLPGRSTADEL